MRQDEVANIASEESESKVFPKNTGAVANRAYRTWVPRLRFWGIQGCGLSSEVWENRCS